MESNKAIGVDMMLKAIEDGKNIEGIPLPAIIWYLVSGTNGGSTEIESRLFEAFCAMRHRAIRLYGALACDLPDESEIEDEPWKLRRGVETLTRANERLERTLAKTKKKREAVQLELETLKEVVHTRFGGHSELRYN